MYARVARFEGVDAAASTSRSPTSGNSSRGRGPVFRTTRPRRRGPSARRSRRFVELVDRENGTLVGITFCETEDDMRRANETLNQLSPTDGGGRRTSVEIYEVAIDEQLLSRRAQRRVHRLLERARSARLALGVECPLAERGAESVEVALLERALGRRRRRRRSRRAARPRRPRCAPRREGRPGRRRRRAPRRTLRDVAVVATAPGELERGAEVAPRLREVAGRQREQAERGRADGDAPGVADLPRELEPLLGQLLARARGSSRRNSTRASAEQSVRHVAPVAESAPERPGSARAARRPAARLRAARRGRRASSARPRRHPTRRSPPRLRGCASTTPTPHRPRREPRRATPAERGTPPGPARRRARDRGRAPPRTARLASANWPWPRAA